MYLRVNDVTLHVDVQGAGEPLLLLHGFTGNHLNWSAFIPKWSKQFQVISVDILGHGLSDAPADPTRYTMERAVHDLITLIDKLHVQKVNVLGYSMGGRLALSLAALEPKLVSKLILVSSSPGLPTMEERSSRVRQDEHLAERIEREGILSFVQYWEEIPLFESIRRMPEEVQRRIRQQRLRNNPVGLANSLRGMGTGAQPSWWEHLAHLTIPVQIIAGEKDTKFDRIARDMQKRIPQSQYTKVFDSGHLVHVEQSHIFDTIVLDFLLNHDRERLG